MNTRTLIIIAVVITIGFFAYKWSGGFGIKFGESEERVKELETKFGELEKQKAESDANVIKWKSSYDSLRGEGARLKTEVSKLHRETIEAQVTAAKSKLQLDSARVKSERLKTKIVELEKNPANRTGDELIESLKNKLK